MSTALTKESEILRTNICSTLTVVIYIFKQLQLHQNHALTKNIRKFITYIKV